MRVIVTDKMAEDGIVYLREKGFDVDTKFGVSNDELLDIIENYDALIVRSATKVTAEVIARGKNLKVVGRAGNGTDNIDIQECTRMGIAVVNTPFGNTKAAAELTIGMIFSLFRNIPQAYMAGKNSDFRRNNFVGAELNGKTAGVIGMGRIGSIVASSLKSLGMKVIAYDPFITDEIVAKYGIEKCDTLEDLLTQSDVITVHIPKTADSNGLIGEKEFKLCKRGVRIVNVARGGIINEKALYNAIKEGIVQGAAIDALEKEPNFNKKPDEQDYTNPLLELDNVIITPHLGASTEEASYNVSIEVAKLVEAVLNGEIVTAVNMPPMKITDMENIKPYAQLAEMLGKIFYQTEKETVEKIEIIYSGDLAEKETNVLTLSVLKGFLDTTSTDKINYVNAQLIAKTKGIQVVESKNSTLDKYTNLITVNYTTKLKTLSVSGTVFAKEEIRIVDFYGYLLDFEPSPHVIIIQNTDQPGIIGRIGTLLGARNINIGAMQWSRNRKRDNKAVAFVSVDSIVGDDVLESLRKIKGVLKVSKVNF